MFFSCTSTRAACSLRETFVVDVAVVVKNDMRELRHFETLSVIGEQPSSIVRLAFMRFRLIATSTTREIHY